MNDNEENQRRAKIELRFVRDEDCKLLWEWANDPAVRANSFSPEAIPWEDHVRWFQSRISDSNCLVYIATDSQIPLGQVRYDIGNDEATISIVVAPQFRGQGYGSEIIRRASQRVFDLTKISTIHAFVKQGNLASVRGFLKADYELIGTELVKEQEAIHLILRRNGE